MSKRNTAAFTAKPASKSSSISNKPLSQNKEAQNDTGLHKTNQFCDFTPPDVTDGTDAIWKQILCDSVIHRSPYLNSNFSTTFKGNKNND